MRCDELSLHLAEAAETANGVELLPGEAAGHVQSCLRCQAELAQYRKLLRALVALRRQYLYPDPSLLDEILEALRPPATVHFLHRRNRRAAYIGGLAAATAAGAAGAIVIASRLAQNRHKLAS